MENIKQIKIQCPHCNKIIKIDYDSEVNKNRLLLDENNQISIDELLKENNIEFGVVER
jgi:uncharacterized C2H2 Zn-finger protein